MKNSRAHLAELQALVSHFEKESGDVVIGKMLPELGALILTLSEELDSAQKKVVRLTWALFWLTLFLAVVGVAQLFTTFNPPESQVSKQVPQSSQDAKSANPPKR